MFILFLISMALICFAVWYYRKRLSERISSENIITNEMLLAMKKHQLGRFTLIEVTMSIAVIAIGMVGVMALFPIGFQASRDAIGDNYSSEAASNFLHVIAQQCKAYSDNGTTVDGWGEWITNNPNKANDPAILQLPVSKPSDANIENIAKKTVNGAVLGDGLGGYTNDACGMYFDDNGINGLFYVESKTGDMVDFSGAIALWIESIECDSNGDGVIDGLDSGIPPAYAVRLCMEISWPIGRPYNQREKRNYVLEIFNPNSR